MGPASAVQRGRGVLNADGVISELGMVGQFGAATELTSSKARCAAIHAIAEADPEPTQVR